MIWAKKDKAKTTPAKEALPEAPKPEPTELGWRLATFALDTLHPDPKQMVTITEVWTAYAAWCASNSFVPIAYAIFVQEFERLANETGMRRYQSGANLVFPGVALNGTTP